MEILSHWSIRRIFCEFSKIKIFENNTWYALYEKQYSKLISRYYWNVLLHISDYVKECLELSIFCHWMVIWTWFYIRLIGVNMFNERYTRKWRDKGTVLFTFLSSMAQKKAAYMGSCMKDVFLFWSRWMKNLYMLFSMDSFESLLFFAMMFRRNKEYFCVVTAS